MEEGYTISPELTRMRMKLPFLKKVEMSLIRIRGFYEKNDGKIYVSFSGGKDSCVLLDLVRQEFPDVEGVFVDTGLEYPDLKEHVRNTKNIKIVRPEKTFKKVIEEYGFPIISKEVSGKIEAVRNKNTRGSYFDAVLGKYGKRSAIGKIPNKYLYLLDAPFKISNKCCDVMKKRPLKKYEKETGNRPLIGLLADESDNRMRDYIKNGCFGSDGQRLRPIMFWTENNIWEYIKKYKIKYPSIYDRGIQRTGCVYCGFGAHINQVNRYKLLKKHYPKLYNFCIGDKGLGFGKVLDFIGVEY